MPLISDVKVIAINNIIIIIIQVVLSCRQEAVIQLTYENYRSTLKQSIIDQFYLFIYAVS